MLVISCLSSQWSKRRLHVLFMTVFRTSDQCVDSAPLCLTGYVSDFVRQPPGDACAAWSCGG